VVSHFHTARQSLIIGILKFQYRQVAHQNLFLLVMVGALDLRHHPENITKKAALLRVKLRFDADSFPIERKLEAVNGSVIPTEEALKLLTDVGAMNHVDAYKSSQEAELKSVRMGLALLLIWIDGMGFDTMFLTVGSASNLEQYKGELDWSSDWVRGSVISLFRSREYSLARLWKVNRVKFSLSEGYSLTKTLTCTCNEQSSSSFPIDVSRS
jgi:hypothetical protein